MIVEVHRQQENMCTDGAFIKQNGKNLRNNARASTQHMLMNGNVDVICL